MLAVHSMDEKPKKTLTDFIEQNQKLLSAIGVFTALSVFINQLPGDLAKSDNGVRLALRVLSSLFCFLAVLTYAEVLKNSFRYYPENGILRWFDEALFFAFMMFIYIWVRTFYVGIAGGLLLVGTVVLVLMMFALFATLLHKFMMHTSFLKSKSQQTRERIIPMVGALILMGVAVAVVAIFLRFHR